MRRTSKARNFGAKEDNRKDMTPKESRERRDHHYRQGEGSRTTHMSRSSSRRIRKKIETSRRNPPKQEENRRKSSTLLLYRRVAVKKVSQPNDI